MRRVPLTIEDFTESRTVAEFEGGSLHAAERGGKFYVIQDESTLGALLNEGDLASLRGELIKVLEFDTLKARNDYVRERAHSNEG